MTEPKLSPTYSGTGSSSKTIDVSSEYELQLERQAVRKIDYMILPVLALINFLGFLDRTNIGNARVAGLQKDLHLTDRQYEICITILLVPYITSELPSNLIFRKIGPRLLVPTLVTIWGIIAALQGFVTSYAGLITARVFLGLVEGPLAPGLALYLSGFYTRKELSLRLALFLSSAGLSGAFSGLLAAAIDHMEGIGGKPGWAWIFILEGLLSVVAGLIGFFLIPSTPSDCQFLVEYQKSIIIKRLKRDRPTMTSLGTFCIKEVLRCITSPHFVITLIMAFMIGTMSGGLALFLPSIVSQLGFSPNTTQLLSVGPFATGFFVTLSSAFLSDRYESRGIPIALVSMLAVAGYSLFLNAKHTFMSYGALYLMVPGVYGLGPLVAAWVANNSEPHYRRATAVAFYFIAANSGGILSTWSFPTNEGPKFRKTTIMNLTFSIMMIVAALTNIAYLSWRNKVKKYPGVRAKLLEKYDMDDDGELKTWMELGDQHPDFVYTL